MITTTHASNSHVTVVTLKRFTVLIFLPSFCVNSLMIHLRQYFKSDLRKGNFICDCLCLLFPDMAPQGRLRTLQEINISRTTNQKQNSTRIGGTVLEDSNNSKTWAKNTVVKHPRPTGRRMNSKEHWPKNF